LLNLTYLKTYKFYQMKNFRLIFVAAVAIAMVGIASCAPKAKEAAKETTEAAAVSDSSAVVANDTAMVEE
jgi:hypothetical protein